MPNTTKHHPAKFWDPEGDSIQCWLCPHRCTLSEGQRGLCLVRTVIDGKLVSTVYALPSALRVDPIEKKPLYHFLPGSQSFSLGTQGCNLKCEFCQNWHLSTQYGHATVQVSPEEIVSEALKAECDSIAFTYNEPIIFAEYAMDIRDLASKAGIPCIMVTNGYITPKARKDVFKGIKAVNIDLKAFSNELYMKYTGAQLDPVLNTIKWCIEEGIHTEITTLIIPGVNDDPEMIQKECQWISKHCGNDVALHISAFHPDYKMKDYPRTSRSILIRCNEIAKKCGLKYTYVGNYPGFDNNTYCPQCGEIILKRDLYHIEGNASHMHKSPIIWSVS
ncbi:MAG: AmmeMemoRadiSam system radical SAM enzyme [Candidatus Marinimicrobia bacterium]|nr:AmmeMemoRadiSam system radical SAM enzyme [Candidatus Neomarinimicrobiota bacterium]